MIRRIAPILIYITILSLVLTACGEKTDCNDPSGCIVIYPGDDIVIAAVFPLTGEDMERGNAAYEAVVQAAKDKETLFGHPIKVVKEDLDCAAPDEDALIELAVNDTIASVIGPFCDQLEPQTFKTISDAGLIQLIITGSPTISTSSNIPITISPNSTSPVDRMGSSEADPDELAYDAAQIVFSSIEFLTSKGVGNTIIIPRQALHDTILSIQSYEGQSGRWNCSPESGCEIFPDPSN